MGHELSEARRQGALAGNVKNEWLPVYQAWRDSSELIGDKPLLCIGIGSHANSFSMQRLECCSDVPGLGADWNGILRICVRLDLCRNTFDGEQLLGIFELPAGTLQP
ncbi:MULTISPECIES: hypothetical protein [unclassified Pseudomonas]|uniref:hypothetical protein n=1 Tax=unclassified Pseudomonas TaxID=196821 RepID=UPI0011AECEC6|nr:MULTISPECIES: hypothetical protein [unclassified Pseudomonas]